MPVSRNSSSTERALDPTKIGHALGKVSSLGDRRLGRLSRRQQEVLTAYVCLTPWLIGFGVFTVGAMAYSLILSFLDTTLLTPPTFVGLGNFGELAADPLFLISMRNTLYYACVSVPTSIALALLAAVLLKREAPGIGFFRALYYLPAVVPGVAASLLWAWMLQPREGLVNLVLRTIGIPGPPWLASEEWAIPGLMLINIWSFGEGMVIFLAGLKGIPSELYEAASLDGAGAFTQFRHVTVPMLTPAILFTLVTGTIGSFQVFTSSFLITAGGPNNATLTLVLYLYRQGFQYFRFGYASAIAWLMFVLIVFWTTLVLRSSRSWVYYEGEQR